MATEAGRVVNNIDTTSMMMIMMMIIVYASLIFLRENRNRGVDIFSEIQGNSSTINHAVILDIASNA